MARTIGRGNYLYMLVFYVGAVFCKTLIETGKDMTLTTGIAETPESILWKYQNDKLVEYENGEAEWYQFEHRAHLNDKTGDLTLFTVYKNDSGMYECEIQVKGQLRQVPFEVEVIDPVSTPKVTCHIEKDMALLQCSVDSPVKPTFKWNGPNHLTHDGDAINVTMANDDSLYICIVGNKVSDKSTEFLLKNCKLDSPDNGARVIIPVVSIVLVVVATATVMGIVFWLKNKGHRESRTEEQNMNHKFQGSDRTEKETDITERCLATL